MSEHVQRDDRAATAIGTREHSGLFLHDVERRYRQGDDDAAHPQRRRARGVGRAIGRAGRAFRRRQVDAAAYRGPARTSRCTARSISTAPPTSTLADAERTRIRRNEIGFVYQSHHLLPEFSALENVMLPQMIRGLHAREAHKRARSSCLSYLGLRSGSTHRPAELSGGEQQRVAIARAVANAPRILLADEPTGNLDPHTAEHVFGALTQLVRASGLAAVIATHNMDLAARMDRRVTLREGKIVEMD